MISNFYGFYISRHTSEELLPFEDNPMKTIDYNLGGDIAVCIGSTVEAVHGHYLPVKRWGFQRGFWDPFCLASWVPLVPICVKNMAWFHPIKSQKTGEKKTQVNGRIYSPCYIFWQGTILVCQVKTVKIDCYWLVGALWICTYAGRVQWIYKRR